MKRGRSVALSVSQGMMSGECYCPGDAVVGYYWHVIEVRAVSWVCV